jgi:hypothetical protein
MGGAIVSSFQAATAKDSRMSFDPNSTNPYSTSTQPTAPKKSNVLLYVLLGLGGAALLACCGCGGAMYFVTQAGLSAAADQLKPQLQSDPVVQEHVGEINSLGMNIMATGNEAQKNPKQPGDPDRIVFDIKGNKGSGQVVGELDQGAGQVRLRNAELRMSTGEAFPLSP